MLKFANEAPIISFAEGAGGGYENEKVFVVGLKVPETNSLSKGKLELASSSKVKSTFVTGVLVEPPTCAIMIEFCPCGPTRRIETSLGKPWAKPCNCTVTLEIIELSSPVTRLVDGYGDATVGGDALSLITIALVFENVNVPASEIEIPPINIAAVRRLRRVILNRVQLLVWAGTLRHGQVSGF